MNPADARSVAQYHADMNRLRLELQQMHVTCTDCGRPGEECDTEPCRWALASTDAESITDMERDELR